MRCLHHVCTSIVFTSPSDASLKASGDNFLGFFFVNLLNFIKLSAFNIKVLSAGQSCRAAVRR